MTLPSTPASGRSPTPRRLATREAMAMWDDLVAVRIVEKDAEDANIVLANS